MGRFLLLIAIIRSGWSAARVLAEGKRYLACQNIVITFIRTLIHARCRRDRAGVAASAQGRSGECAGLVWLQPESI
jgi:hypothetical protein